MGQAAASSDPDLAATFRPFRDDPKLQAEIVTLLSPNARARRHLLTAFDLLEQSLAYDVANEQSQVLLDQAEQQLAQALELDGRNATAHLLLANCCFNQAEFYASGNKMAEAEKKVQQYRQALERAYQNRGDVKVQSVGLEIQADYNLLYRKDYAQAVTFYEQLANAADTAGLQSVLRAHWMLAGIYSGDWGATEQIADADKCAATWCRSWRTGTTAAKPSSSRTTCLGRGQGGEPVRVLSWQCVGIPVLSEA